MMKAVAISCIIFCVLVIAYVVKIYLESPKLGPPKEKKNKLRADRRQERRIY